MRPPSSVRALPLVLLLHLATGTAGAQSVERILHQGDPIPGGGNARRFTSLAIDSTAGWFARVEFSEGGQNRTVFLRDGELVLATEQTLPALQGVTVASLGTPSVGSQGDFAAIVSYSGAGQPAVGLH